ncbi:MAG: hypothetical protein JO257_12065 [Deltaproteobacteria bacterium]|nr:hypothetical protein [Deltaproteobacteria bacterium]
MKKLVVWATFAAAAIGTSAAIVTASPAKPAAYESPAEPMSVKPDAGIQWDAGAPLPPIPDGGPIPQTRDASVPLNDPAHAAVLPM